MLEVKMLKFQYDNYSKCLKSHLDTKDIGVHPKDYSTNSYRISMKLGLIDRIMAAVCFSKWHVCHFGSSYIAVGQCELGGENLVCA